MQFNTQWSKDINMQLMEKENQMANMENVQPHS